MTKQEFAEIVNSVQVRKSQTANGGPSLSLEYPVTKPALTAANSPESIYKEKRNRFIGPFNYIIDRLAQIYGYDGDVTEFHAISASDVECHVIDFMNYSKSKSGVYIRTKRDYNINGSKKGTHKKRDNGGTHTMKNRKINLSLITLKSGATLTLQITGASKDAIAWTKFIDTDLSAPEYDNAIWTKDVASLNQTAVDAVDAMIQIEQDFVDGKLDKETALEQLRNKYVEWVVAHLQTNPEFVERRIPGLNCENPMSIYLEESSGEYDTDK